MKKVTINISQVGFEIVLQLGDKTFTEKHEKLNMGSKLIEGNFEDEIDIPDEMYYPLENIAMNCSDVMDKLNK